MPSTPGPEWIAALVRTCRSAVEETEPAALVQAILTGALETIGGETAFLVTSDTRREPQVQAMAPDPTVERERSPSWTVLRNALGCRSPKVWLDVRTSRIFNTCESIRQTGIRSVMAAPVRWDRFRSASLVLDSRMDKITPFARMPDLLGLYAVLLGSAIERLPAVSDLRSQRSKVDRPRSPLAGNSSLFRSMIEKIDRFARCRLPVLIHGETGTGKEGVARMLHELGPRRNGPFVAVNCAAMPEGLLESELFGALKGSYTGATRDRSGLFREAEGGTILLDEVGDMPPGMQARLLRVLQDGRVRPVGSEREIPVDARVVAASHRDLPLMVAEGRFRADLYHRLAVLKLDVPPLRARLEDLPALIRHISPGLEEASGSPPATLSASGIRALQEHAWPGNIRELETVLARALIQSQGRPITADILEFETVSTPGRNRPAAFPSGWTTPFEISFLEAAIVHAGGNLAKAAACIGWTRQKLYRRMRILGLSTRECS